ncbi:uncharacterized protein EV422DRAFT_480633, partial [Fimicolochytrium jonesii]|uniref:uncharacterized protein n=1 Tax=Fimicolochytrium jonesii TaxID=1396493 RepID=UPI0022FE829D
PGMPITIGKPFANNSYYLLDEHLQHVPVGGTGQLYVGGIGVSLGYIGNAGLTAKKFLPDPFSNEAGARMYATGDFVRRLDNNDFEFAGRTDEQVKINGYRVGLNEITTSLLRGAGVELAAAFVHENVLIGCVSPSNVDLAAIKKTLIGFLPHYAIPGKIFAIDEFPQTFNGKAD